jgi:hypothetical protein
MIDDETLKQLIDLNPKLRDLINETYADYEEKMKIAREQARLPQHVRVANELHDILCTGRHSEDELHSCSYYFGYSKKETVEKWQNLAIYMLDIFGNDEFLIQEVAQHIRDVRR